MIINRRTFSLNSIADSFPDALILILIGAFVVFYVSVLTGWLKPTVDFSVLSRLEPLVLLFIGYYFGRLPSARNERNLKEEILRQTQKADAACQMKERANCEIEVLDEKIKNAKAVLLSTPLARIQEGDRTAGNGSRNLQGTENNLRVIGTAVGILNS